MRFLLVIVLVLIAFVPLQRSAAVTTNCSADPSLSALETEFISLLNQYRASNGAGPVSNSVVLSTGAQWMANDLASHQYFSHTDSTGRDFFTREANCGVNGPAGENIAGGQPTAAGVLAVWKSSPGHNSNMLNPTWTRIGVGFAPGGVYGVTWVTDFGLAQAEPDLCPYTPGWNLVALSGTPSGLPGCVSAAYGWSGGVWTHWFRYTPAWVSTISSFSVGSAYWLFVR